MMRRFRVKIEGESYEVEVEEIETEKRPSVATATPASTPSATTAAPSPPVTRPAPRAAPRPSTVAAGGEVVRSPMPGTILSIMVKPGDAVSEGQALVVLESMKIRSEIVAPRSGTVKQVHVTEGKYVRTAEPLVEIE